MKGIGLQPWRACYFKIHTPKTETGKRKIPMHDSVKRAFIAEKLYQEGAYLLSGYY